jgi:hypothetical protein
MRSVLLDRLHNDSEAGIRELRVDAVGVVGGMSSCSMRR